MTRVLGVDGCRDGWVGVAPDPEGPRAYAAPDLRTLLALADRGGSLARVGVDIAIGLVDEGWRDADRLAAAVLGRRRSSIFTTPVRAALEAPDHATGVAVSRSAAGAGSRFRPGGCGRRSSRSTGSSVTGRTGSPRSTPR